MLIWGIGYTGCSDSTIASQLAVPDIVAGGLIGSQLMVAFIVQLEHG